VPVETTDIPGTGYFSKLRKQGWGRRELCGRAIDIQTQIKRVGYKEKKGGKEPKKEKVYMLVYVHR
jgi:hypothetical protein